MNMKEEQPQIIMNPEEIEVEAKAKAASTATVATAGGGGVFDLEAAARDEQGDGEKADATAAAASAYTADNLFVDGSSNAFSSPSTKRCNRHLGVIGSFLGVLFVAALFGGGYSLHRSRNQISKSMMESASDCKDEKFDAGDLAVAATPSGDQPIRRLSKSKGKCVGKSTCSSADAGLYIDDKYVSKTLEDSNEQIGKYVPLAFSAILTAFMEQVVVASAVTVTNSRENVRNDDVGFVLGDLGFKFEFHPENLDIDLKVDKAAKEFVKDFSQGRGGGRGGRGRGGRGRGGKGRCEGKGGCGGRGRARGGRGGRDVDLEIEKDALTIIEAATVNLFVSLYKKASKAAAAKGSPIRVKHVILGATKVIPKSFSDSTQMVLVETIISCACAGKLKLNLGKLTKWLKFSGMIFQPGFRFRIEPDTAVLLGTLQQAATYAVVEKAFEDASVANLSVLEENDIIESVAKYQELNDYFNPAASFPVPATGLPNIPVREMAKKMDPRISLSDNAVAFINEKSGVAVTQATWEAFELAEEKQVQFINRELVKDIIMKQAPQVIIGQFNPLINAALKSFDECKATELPGIGDDYKLTDEFLLEMDGFDFEDEGEDPEE